MPERTNVPLLCCDDIGDDWRDDEEHEQGPQVSSQCNVQITENFQRKQRPLA